MRSYGMSWNEAIKIAPDLANFINSVVCPDAFDVIIDCLNNALMDRYFHLDTDYVVTNICMVPEGGDGVMLPYFIILES